MVHTGLWSNSSQIVLTTAGNSKHQPNCKGFSCHNVEWQQSYHVCAIVARKLKKTSNCKMSQAVHISHTLVCGTGKESCAACKLPLAFLTLQLFVSSSIFILQLNLLWFRCVELTLFCLACGIVVSALLLFTTEAMPTSANATVVLPGVLSFDAVLCQHDAVIVWTTWWPQTVSSYVRVPFLLVVVCATLLIIILL
jgi:hypothetical protein